MNKLPMCRICLAENVRMYVVVNSNLQELYEKLTNIPFITEDSRPILACFFCCAKLKQCYRLLRQCLEAEELFAQMMNENYEPNPLINQDHLEFYSGFIKSPIEHITCIDDGCQTENIDIKEELPAVCEGLDDIIEPKEEHQSDELELENFDNSCLDVADIPVHHSESDLNDDVPVMEFKIEVEEEQVSKNHSESDSEDDVPLMEFKIEVKVEQGSDKKRRASETNMYRSESESETEINVTKKQRNAKNWIFLKQFCNGEEAINFVNSECTWSRNYTRHTEDGQKRFYRCNKVKRRGPQCYAELYLLYVNDDDKVNVYQTDSEHNHDAIGTRDNYGIREKTKEEINKLFDLRLKPKAILSELAKIEGIHLPMKRQLNNYLSDRRTPKFSKSGICLGELEQWIFKRTAIPEDDNEVFVISYHVIEGDQPSFRFNLSTKTLLKMFLFTDLIHTDATYKLIWQGFPVLIVGTTDKNRKFHPICLGVANERQEDFQIMFQGIKEKVMELYDYTMKPRVLICDAAHSIKNAFTEVFGEEPTIRMCWAHAKINIQKKVEKIVPKKYQKSVLRDVDALHNAASLELFNAASQAFLEKWKTQTNFLKYMEEEWFRKNRNWFVGAAPMSPSTNNALESFNRNIKDHNTLRERFPLSRFLSVATDMVAQWSLENSSLPEELTIELKQWTEAYVWAKKCVNIKVIASDSTKKVYLICTENAKDLNYNDRWQTFDEYKKLSAAFQKTTLPNSDWQKGSCDCYEFFNKYVCKHVLGLAIRLKLTTPPLEAKMIPIGQKRKRGRPAKSKPALIYQ